MNQFPPVPRNPTLPVHFYIMIAIVAAGSVFYAVIFHTERKRKDK